MLVVDDSIPKVCSWLTCLKAIMAGCVELAAWPVAMLGHVALKPVSVQAGLRLGWMMALHATQPQCQLWLSSVCSGWQGPTFKKVCSKEAPHVMDADVQHKPAAAAAKLL